MSQSFKISDYEDGKLIVLSEPLNDRAKFLDLFYVLMFISCAVVFAGLGYNIYLYSMPFFIFCMLAAIVLGFGGCKFIVRVFETEKVFINHQRFEIIKTALFKKRLSSFQLSEISDFRFNGEAKFEDHPLKGTSFDYLGFQTEQKVIEHLHKDGRIAFKYRNQTIFFGKELYSWDFEELKELLYQYSGNDLRYTDEYERKRFGR